MHDQIVAPRESEKEGQLACSLSGNKERDEEMVVTLATRACPYT